MQEFLDFVARLFKVDPKEISLETAYQSIPQWDSLMQLRLVMEIEEEYGVEIPIDKVPELTTLQHFFDYLNL